MKPMTLEEFGERVAEYRGEPLVRIDRTEADRIAMALREREELKKQVADLQAKLDKALKGWAQEHERGNRAAGFR